ncbi:hypothetical protein EVC30_110 [Rhizobium phage RHph_Y1_11]|nr:hypothetical protein EVC30_110 [Rhizobium phage RHph_Y1_11]
MAKTEHRYQPCGGCGASDPMDRCVGCFHIFIPGDWPETVIDRTPRRGPSEKDVEPQIYSDFN